MTLMAGDAAVRAQAAKLYFPPESLIHASFFSRSQEYHGRSLESTTLFRNVLHSLREPLFHTHRQNLCASWGHLGAVENGFGQIIQTKRCNVYWSSQ